MRPAARGGLYDGRHEHDSCGVGFVADLSGRRSHETVANGLTVLRNLEHRGAKGSEPETGDGAGILTQIPDALYRAVTPFALPDAGAYAAGIAAGSHSNLKSVVLAGFAGLGAGAFSMAAGEYVSVRSQSELALAEVEVERTELESNPLAEQAELAESLEETLEDANLDVDGGRGWRSRLRRRRGVRS